VKCLSFKRNLSITCSGFYLYSCIFYLYHVATCAHTVEDHISAPGLHSGNIVNKRDLFYNGKNKCSHMCTYIGNKSLVITIADPPRL
jgi:hypothetical protein